MTDPIHLLHEYFHRIDGRDPDGAAELFAPDARARFMLGPWFEGRAQIAGALQGILTSFTRTSHHVTNVREVGRDEENAELFVYVYAYHRLAETGRPWHFWGRLRDVFVLNDDGWLIHEHVLDGIDAAPDRRRIPQEGYSGQPGRVWDPLPDPGEPARNALALVNRATVEELEELQARVEADGVLGPGRAALVAACAAAALGFEIGCRNALERARKAQLPPAEAWAAASVLLAARGQAVAYPFADALLALYRRPDAERAYDTLEPRLAELILCGVSAAERKPDEFRLHATAARRAGAGDAEIRGAVTAVAAVAGSAPVSVLAALTEES